jgi:hypothetical protein
MGKVTDVLKKPVGIGVLAGIAGIILGLVWAWMVDPVQWVNADPSFLSPDYQRKYLCMVIESYISSGDRDLASLRYQETNVNGKVALSQMLSETAACPGGPDATAIRNFVNIIDPELLVSTPTPSAGGTTPTANSTTSGIIIAVIVVVVGVVGYFVLRLMRPLIKKSGEQTPVQQAQQIDRDAQKTNYVEMNEEPPIMQVMNTYVVGDDLYTHSIEINGPEGSYLGNCGLEIDDSIPLIDKPKRVRGIGV